MQISPEGTFFFLLDCVFSEQLKAFIMDNQVANSFQAHVISYVRSIWLYDAVICGAQFDPWCFQIHFTSST